MKHRKNRIMIQGTGSDVGKSLLVAGLCRAYYSMGHKVCPFKPQNMSNNAGVARTESGAYGEIGRAQMTQAVASHISPSVHMNPVLLKPQSQYGSQVIVHGKPYGTASAQYFRTLKPELLAAVMDSFSKIQHAYDAIVIEGAGSPAEVNLRAGDIANMGFAEAADVPVILLADIDRGGSIAQVVGTHAVLSESERTRIKGYIINKFRGDIALYQDAIDIIHSHTGWQCFGVLPWFDNAHILPAEDAMGLDKLCHTHTPCPAPKKPFKICVPRTLKMANFDDLDPLRQTPNVVVDVVSAPRSLPQDCDVIMLMGSKSTVSDMQYMRDMGWDKTIIQHAENGGWVIGICGGYQMLGTTIADPHTLESAKAAINGLGLLDMHTVLQPQKTVRAVSATHTQTGTKFTGYEIHMGHSTHPYPPFCLMDTAQQDGAIRGRVMGSYVHGLFHSDNFRHQMLRYMGCNTPYFAYGEALHTALDTLATHLHSHLDMEAIWSAGYM